MSASRSRRLLLLALLALAGARPAAAQGTPRNQAAAEPAGEVRGVVRAAPDAASARLPYAMVELIAGDVRRTVLADSAGRYVLSDVPAGMRRVRALHVGYALGEVEVLVPAGGTVEVDLQLARQPVALAALRVLAPPITLPDVEPMSLRASTPAWAASEIALRSLADGNGMAEAGLARAAGGQGGGGNDPADPRDVLLMRGSTTDLKLVLLDGAPVYTPFHLGGLLPSFDATTMGGAALHVGGAPARYDGGLSYILDLRTRAPRGDRLHGGATLDLMSAQASLEGPLGAHAGVLAAGRALHDGAAALWGGSGSPYGYRDGLVRLAADPSDEDHLSLTAFTNREAVFLDLPATVGLAGPDAARWGNDALALRYEGVFGATLLDATGAVSRYDAELPVPASAADRGANRAAPKLATGRTDRLRATVDASQPLARGTLRFGGSADQMRVRYGARRLGIAEALAQDVATSGLVTGGYVDLSKPAGPSVHLRFGLRADRFSTDPGLRWAPRAALSWSLSDAALLTLAAGRYHQYTRSSDAQVDDAVRRLAAASTWPVGAPIAGTGADDLPEARALLSVATADHLVLSLDQQLEPRTRMGIQGFLKGFTGLDESAARTTSSGLDLRIVREGDELTGWLGYSLAWFWSADRLAASGGSTSTSRFSGRHLLSAGLSGRLKGPLGMDLRVAFSDGLPYTAVRLGAEAASDASAPNRPTVDSDSFGSDTPALSGGPTGSFLRIDAELYAELRRGLRPYVKLLNALDRRDALFWYFAPWRDPSVRPLAELSLLPVVGLEWRF